MAKAPLTLVTPTTEKRTLTPRRPKNADVRTREHLTKREVDRLIDAVKDNRNGNRDALMVLLTYRHGLRASELVDLRWEQVELETATLHVRRVKAGLPSSHPLTGRELRELRRHQRKSESQPSPFVFVSQRGVPFTTAGFARMIERAAVAANLGILAHPHMLRHGCGYKMANDGIDTRTIQSYLGHSNIANTVRYTALASDRFKGIWRD
jgi:site-specific recombinase XerD